MTAALKRVLIVDDEEDLTWSISKNLSKDKDKFDLICVNSGTEALKIMSQVQVDLVVSDIRMPEINGLDLLLEIKEKYGDVKVIIMTAYGSPDYEKTAFERGCIYYLEKPFEISHLRELIIDSLNEKKGFVGQVSDFQLSDIIQMNCLGRLTTALYVEKGKDTGVIFFRDGNIVHAEANNLSGEDAFYRILSWEGGSFSSKKGFETTEETIFKGWQSLLLEGMKRADEGAAYSSVNAQSVNEIKKMIAELNKIDGIDYVCLLDEDFSMVLNEKSNLSSAEIDISALIDKVHDLVEKAVTMNELADTGSADAFTFKFEQFYLHIVNILKQNEYLLVIGNQQINTGKLTITLKKVIKKVESVKI